MLTDPDLRSKVDQLWNQLWTGGLSNPLDAIEQFSYLLFLKRLEDIENQRKRQAQRRGEAYTPRIPDEVLWSHWTQMEAPAALAHVKEVVFPAIRQMSDGQNSFSTYMQNAEFKINKPNLLISACKLIDQMQISQQNQDVQGDLYEYMLSYLSVSGRNGQFRTPRHIIHLMVSMIDPRPGERIGDLAAGTGGFLVNAYQHILAEYTSPDLLEVDKEGDVHNAIGDQLTDEQREWLQNHAFRGYDNDSGMTMLRIGSMNLMLHGLESPRFFYQDTLSTSYKEPDQDYDVILMNPPFKGAVDKDDMHPGLPKTTTKSELLFVHQILRVLDMGGRAAVIVPDGVLFGSSNAHIALRKKLIDENRLDGVVSMPSGVFKPYAGVSTAILLFTRGGETQDIWFFDMEHDGFSLDDKRTPTPEENDLASIFFSWQQRHDLGFAEERASQLAELRATIEPLHQERLNLEREIHRLKFELAIAHQDDPQPQEALEAVEAELEQLLEEIQPIKREINDLTKQFWVSKKEVQANNYDLSASRYREVDQDPVFYEDPEVTIERMMTLEQTIAEGMQRIQEQLNG